MSQGHRLPADDPWPPIGTDPATGLPNFLSFISDLENIVKTNTKIAVGIRATACGLSGLPESMEPDSLVSQVLSRIETTRRSLGIEGIRIYRLTCDSLCSILPCSMEQGEEFVQSLSRSFSEEKALCGLVCGIAPFPCSFVSAKEALAAICSEAFPGSDGASLCSVEHVMDLLVRSCKDLADALIETRKLAYTDDISGLPNQRAARYIIEEYLAQHQEDRAELSLLFVDGDNLRQYNDELGYGPGNEMIRRLGEILCKSAVQGELVTRWLSGDEFMVILPEVDKRAAFERAEEICKKVKQETSDWAYPVTVSIGIATFPDDGPDWKTLQSKVEEANAQAKRMGKNRVFSA